jgi:hypothetical protein
MLDLSPYKISNGQNFRTSIRKSDKSNVLCDEFSTAYAIFFDALEKLSKIPESVSEKVMDMAKNPEKYNAYYEKHPNVAKAIQTLFKDSDNPDKSKPKHKEMN